ncbi:MAG: hypothetical protein EXQ79_02890 [Acidimicrobiia bacterium]|nr:hypothetical protein [Acidimicrobiia bacterium]
MLPFERLRSLARSGADDSVLVAETADCLSEFGEDTTQLVTVCRRLLAHHVDCGPLWWLCAHVVAAANPADGARDAMRRLQADRTATRLASLLPFPHDEPIAVLGWPEIAGRALAERPDLDVVAIRPRNGDRGMTARLRRVEQPIRVVDEAQVAALGPTHLIVETSAASPTTALVPEATADLLWGLGSTPLWLVVATGRLLPPRLFDVLHAEVQRQEIDLEELDVTKVVEVAGPSGLEAPDRLKHRVDCPAAPELLRL